MEIEIGPGEEKLAQAFEMIVALQHLMLALSQRTEVDAILIGLLLDRITDPQAALRQWSARIAEYYPARALDHLSDAQMARSSEELNRRIDLWTRALESRAAAANSND